MFDTVLCLIFNLTGSRAVSEMISERRVNAKWEAAKRAHIAAGGVCMTMASRSGEQSYLVGGA